MLNINKKNLLTTTALEIVFTILFILLLVLVRYKSLDYLHSIQDLSGDIEGLKQQLETQNLGSYDKEQVQSTLTKMNSLLNKGLILIKVVLPLSLIILSLIFYFLIWRIVSGVSIIRFLYAAIIPFL